MSDITTEEADALIEALESDGLVPTISEIFMLELGLAQRECSPRKKFHPQTRLTPAGRLLAQALKRERGGYDRLPYAARSNPVAARGDEMTAKKSRSGTQWTDADYASAGYARLSLRLPVEVKARLQRLAAERECSIAELAGHLAAAEEKRLAKKSTKNRT